MEIEETLQRIKTQLREKKGHGTTTSYNCPMCRDTTWIITEGKAKRCECYRINRVKDMWRASGVNPEQREKTFKSYIPYSPETKKAKDMALNYFKTFRENRDTRHNSIAFLGQVGSGKTHLSMALAVNFLNRGVPVVYMPYRGAIMDIKLNILNSEHYKECMKRYQRAEVLLIDDLYKGKISQSDLNIMFEIINHRYLNHKPIIISSEMNIEEIIRVDEGIGTRIYEMCRTNNVFITGRGNNFRKHGELKSS